ncbi:MAG: hypothetical protein HY814_08230 [Candidatus Riflebacteria bacterium]|nr:hypothetical protein [Candidatus Riflebacteria bacterium]
MTRGNLLCGLILTAVAWAAEPAAVRAAGEPEGSAPRIGVILRFQAHQAIYVPRSRDPERNFARAERFFRRHAPSLASRPGRWRNENQLWRLVQMLEDGGFRARLEAMLVRFHRSTAVIRMQLGATSRCWPGVETLEGGRKVLMIEDDTLARACRSDGDLRALLLHELAHLVDRSEHKRDYGAVPESQGHLPREILTPSMALFEGWAHYFSLSSGSEELATLARRPAPDVYLRLERGRSQTGPRLNLDRLRLADQVSTALIVGNILDALAHLPPGDEALWSAVEASWRVRDPTIAEVLAAYLRRNPEQRGPVRAVVVHQTGRCGSVLETSRLLAGLLPRGVARSGCPRRR